MTAGKQAFVDAKCRFSAEINNLQCNAPLPGPDIYIDDVDWNGADVDPELIWDSERSRGPQEPSSQEHEVVILGLNSRNLYQMRMSSAGCGDEFEENAPQNNADYQENPWERKAEAFVGGGGWWGNGGWKKWGNNNYSGGHTWKNNNYYRGDGNGAYWGNFKSDTWNGWKGYGQHGGGWSKSKSRGWKPWRYRGGDCDQKGGGWWRNGSWGKRNRIYDGEHGGGWSNSNSGEWKPLRNGGGD